MIRSKSAFLEEIPSFHTASVGWLMTLPGIALYLVLLKVMQDERALAFAVSFGVFYTVISREWDQRHQSRFWLIIAGFVVLHVIALSVMKLPHYRGPTLAVVFPFAMADGFAMWGILNWIERRFPTTN